MSTGAYSTAYAASLANPTAFWGEAAKDIGWITPPTTVLDDSRPPFYRWFPDGTLNTCFNAIDRHVAGGRADQVAIHYDSPVTGRKDSFTYAELLAHVSPRKLVTQYPVNDPNLMQMILGEAKEYWDRLTAFDNEDASLYMQPNYQGGMQP